MFKKKLSQTNETSYKARLVVRGCAQRQGIDYQETFSPVVKYNSIRYLLSLAASEGLRITHMDVTTAYLNGELEEDIYVKPPDEIEGSHKLEGVWKLKKAMYGLKQSGRVWNKKLDTILREYGLEKSKADPCIYHRKLSGKRLIVAIYVDDLLIFSKEKHEEKRLKKSLQQKFEMKDLGNAKQFLGINIERNERHGNIHIHQSEYIKRTLERFRMQDCNPISTPADPNVRLTAKTQTSKSEEDKDISKTSYQEAVGSLLYLSQISRPDISFAVNQVSKFNINPDKQHWNAVKRIFKYLKGTINYKLRYSKDFNEEIIGYSDANWANDPECRKSITGTVFIKNGGAISWASKLQRTVALSTVEAEYIALATTCQEALWLQELRSEIEPEKKTKPMQLFSDNNGAISLSKNACMSQRSKHIDTRYHFLRDNIERNNVVIKHVSTEDMTADIFTKPLPKIKVEFHTKSLGLLD